jgi:hypothetical protein
MSRPTISCLISLRTPGEGSQTRRSSRSAWRRRSWGSRLTDGFLAVASRHLRHLFPSIPGQAGYFKRRRALVDTLEWLMEVFASQSPGFYDDLLLVDSTPVECARSRETVKRSQLADAADYGYCASHSRFFWGFRCMRSSHQTERPEQSHWLPPNAMSARSLSSSLTRTRRQGPVALIGDKGYAGREFAQRVSNMDATILRPSRKDEPGRGPHLAPIRQRIESIFWSCKDILTLERNGARTLPGLRERILQRLLTLAAAVCLNHQLGRPSRSLVSYCA